MPGSTSSHRFFYYVYVLESMTDGKRYIGMTRDLHKRINQHHRGEVISTAPRRPFKLIYCEACTIGTDASRREKYLKTTDGRRFLAKRLRDYYQSFNANLS